MRISTTNKDWQAWKNKYGNPESGHVSTRSSEKLMKTTDVSSIDVFNVPISGNLLSSHKTAAQPKQVSYDTKTNLLCISCLSGRRLEIYKNPEKLELIKTFEFDLQCVEVITETGFCYFTLTDFSYDDNGTNYLGIVDLEKLVFLGMVKTGGLWSKYITVNRSLKHLYVSNWHSNSISIFDISNNSEPEYLTSIECGISPRGICVGEDPKIVYVACYYSRNIIELRYINNEYVTANIGDPYDYPKYSGNMRDILNLGADKYVVSNMGRNLLHLYDSRANRIVYSLTVGKSPNSISKVSKGIVVSCKGDDCLVIVDEGVQQVKSVIYTGRGPTGLSSYKDYLFCTCFDEGLLQVFKTS